ncbi:MAG: Crp/Fnr family transcriptional regulator [Paracoccaceae bacterium]
MARKVDDRFPEGTALRECGPDGCAALAKYWTEATYPARALIVSEDETDDDVFFILSGRARAATYTDSGKEVFMSDMQAGESFGIFAAIDGQPRSTNVIAVEDARIARMSAANFNKVLYSHSAVTRAFILYLVDRVRHLSTRMTAVTTRNAEQRLIAELLRLAEAGMTGDDTARIEPLPTQQDFATLLFSQREAIGRDMSKLKDAGLIERKGRSLLIKSISGLEARMHEG